MGICASCLGARRRSTQQPQDDLDRILSVEQPNYGTLDDNDSVQPDEEELEREREALQNITAHATDNMIDVLRPSHSEQNFALRNASQRASSRSLHKQHTTAAAAVALTNPGQMTDEDAAWLESIRAADADVIHMPRRSRLVMDINLRESGQQQKMGRHETAH